VIVIGHSNLRDGMTVRVAGQDTPGAPLPASAGAQDTQPQQASPSGQPGTGGPQSAAQQPAPEPDAVAQPVSETGRSGL
jgi:hypothetical protein